jgi:hypothetical protein
VWPDEPIESFFFLVESESEFIAEFREDAESRGQCDRLKKQIRRHRVADSLLKARPPKFVEFPEEELEPQKHESLVM